MRRPAAGAVAALAAAALLAGCGSDGGASARPESAGREADAGGSPASPPPDGSGSPDPSEEAARPGEQETQEEQEQPGSPEGSSGAPGVPEEGPAGDTVPVEELTPPAGDFSEEEKDYLTDRVPEGADPAAILELGSEACDRIGYLERNVPGGAGPALRDDDIPGAEAAVENLCPEYADLLAGARGTRGES